MVKETRSCYYRSYLVVLSYRALLLVTDIMATVVIPETFENAFRGNRAYLAKKISLSATFWNLMTDSELLSTEHVQDIKVFVFFY